MFLNVAHRRGINSDGESTRYREPRDVGWRIAIHVAGALATILLWAAATFAFGFVAFGTSVCGAATGDQVRDFRLALLGYGLLVASVPLAAGAIIGSIGERSWPWFAVAGIVSVVAVIGVLTAQPAQWCF